MSIEYELSNNTTYVHHPSLKDKEEYRKNNTDATDFDVNKIETLQDGMIIKTAINLGHFMNEFDKNGFTTSSFYIVPQITTKENKD
jgi:hypothetical protein